MGSEEEVKRASAEEEVRSSGAIGRVSLITFASRLLGLAREMTKAFFLGTGHAADAFTVGFMIPNLLRRFLAEGVMAAAVVPVFTEYLSEKEREEVRRFVCVLLGSLLLLLGIVVSAGVLLAPHYIALFFSDYGPEKVDLTAALTAIMFPYIGFVSLASLVQGVLFSHGRFSLPAFCPVALNVVVISAVWIVAPRGNDFVAQAEAARVMATAVLAGGFVQFLLLIPELLRLGYSLKPSLDSTHEGLRRVVKLLVPVAMGGGIHQINTLVALFLAARLGYEGAVASLNYSNRLLELALGVFVVSVITVALPGLARLWNQQTKTRYFAQAAFALRLVLLVSVPAGLGLLFLRREIITVLLSFGAFGDQSVALTEYALLFHAVSVPLVGCSRFFAQALYATRDSRTPLRVGTVVAVVNILLCLLLVGELMHGGIALAMTISSGVGVVLYRRIWFARHGRESLPGVYPFAVRVVVAGLLMGLFHTVWTRYLIPFPGQGGRFFMSLHLAGAVIVDAAFFFSAVRLAGVRELPELFGTLIRRRRYGNGESVKR